MMATNEPSSGLRGRFDERRLAALSFLDRQFGRRIGLEAFIGDRVAAEN